MVKVGVKLIALQPCKQCIVYMRCVELPESQPKETKGTLWSNSNINSPINKAKGKLSRKREKFGNFIKGGGRSPYCLSGKLCLGEDAHVIVMPECSLCAFWVISLCWMSVLWVFSELYLSVQQVFSQCSLCSKARLVPLKLLSAHTQIWVWAARIKGDLTSVTMEVTRQTMVRMVQGAKFDKELRPEPDQRFKKGF